MRFRRTCAIVCLPAAVACGGDPEAAVAPPAPGPAPDAPSQPASPVPTPEADAPSDVTTTPGRIDEGIVPDTIAPPAGDDMTSGSGSGSAVPPVVDETPPSAGCPAAEALLGVLQQLAPADEDLAEDFGEYLTEELGTLSCATAGTGGERTITQTIVVPPNTVYDGRGETLSADPVALNCDLTEGEQGESQRPFFLLAPGASLKNVTITYPGCEGIHMMGDNVLDNVTWIDVGEDAASVRSYFPGGEIAILNSRADHARDKTFQFNAPVNVLIQNFVGTDMGKLVRQNGGTEFELRVDLNTVNVTEVVSAVVQSDSPLFFVRHHALTFDFTGTSDRSDRVFRDVPPENVSEY